ncbi:MAG: hypothetical protein ABEJ61_02690 [Haloferacaceae archaeon]
MTGRTARRLLTAGGYLAVALGVLCLVAGVVATVVVCTAGRCARHVEIQVAVLAVLGAGVVCVLAGGGAVLAARAASTR